MNKTIGTLLILALLALPPAGAETDPKGLAEDRRDVLRYGIETEILELVAALKSEKNKDLVTDLREALRSTRSNRLRKAVLDYFTEMALPEAEGPTHDILMNADQVDSELLAACVEYLRAIRSRAGKETVLGLLERNDDRISGPVVRYLGAVGGGEAVPVLVGIFDDGASSSALRSDVLRALGALGAGDSVDFLLRIAGAEDEETGLRRLAVEALGKTGDRRAEALLTQLYGSGDNLMRAAAFGALVEVAMTESLLHEGLRDQFWRIREFAAEKAGQAGASMVGILIYKADRDPERRIRLAAVRSLGRIGNPEAVEHLQGLLVSRRQAVDLRAAAAAALASAPSSETIGVFKRVMDEEWKKQGSALLDAVCRELSTVSDPGLASLFEAMLDHPSMVIKIYGIRGARLNRLSHLKPRIQTFTAETVAPALRKNAIDAVTSM